MPDLTPLLSPASVAVIGASNDTDTLRGRIMHVLDCHDFGGSIYPVSRSQPTVMGRQAYAAISDIPEKVDLAILIIPAVHVPATLEDCAACGVKAALILASGFAEEESADGFGLQTQIREIAARSDMLIAGPNSEGFANLKLRLCATFSPAVEGEDMVLVPEWSKSGRIAVVAQSGGMGFAFYDRGRPKQLRFSHIVTTGNEACIESLDVVEHLIDKDEADVFLIFMEDVKTPAKLAKIAEKALHAGKPIIVTKIGHSDAGIRAAASHTASLAGSHRTYRAIFDRYGVIEGQDTEEMVDIAAGFAYFGDRLPAGRRIGIFTASGGGGGWLADSCVAAGLEVPMLDPVTRAEIDKHLPSYGTSQNPVDGTAGVVRTLGYARISSMIAASGRIDAVIAITSARNASALTREREALADLAATTAKPVFIWSYTLPHPDSINVLACAGLPLFINMNNSTRTVVAMARYHEVRNRVRVGRKPRQQREIEPTWRQRLVAAPVINTEIDTMTLLANAGIDVIGGTLARTADEAAAAVEAIGKPVALKIQSPDLLHKSDAGGVMLGVEGRAAAAAGFEKLHRQIAVYHPTARVLGVLVQPLAPPGLEMIVGIENRTGFGPVVMVGFGGTAVEASGDVSFAAAPLDRVDAEEMLAGLRGSALLNGSKYDINAVLNLVSSLSTFASINDDIVAEIDLNPVIVHGPGQGVSVVDALLIKHAEA